MESLEKCHRTRKTSRTSKAAKAVNKAVVVSRSPASKIPASKISSQAKSRVRADSRNPAIKSATTTLPRRECRGIFIREAPESRVDDEECFRWADEAETEEFKDTFIQMARPWSLCGSKVFWLPHRSGNQTHRQRSHEATSARRLDS